VKLVLDEQFAMAFVPPAGLKARADCLDRTADRA
jgi:hypothetical protein